MILLLSLLLGWASATPTTPEAHPANGGSTAGSAATEAGRGSFADLLDQGKQLYFDGRPVEAQEILLGLERRLLLGEDVALALRAEALIWLGEIQYRLGRHTEAREAFRWLLQQDPEWPISPYAHPMEVIGEFELVRRQVLDEMEQQRGPVVDPVVAPSAPLWTWAPLGIPQVAQKRAGAAALFGGIQLGLGAASIGYATHLRRMNVDPAGHPRGWTEEEIGTRIDRGRYLVQWPLTFAFYGTWLASSVEARRHHRRSHRDPGAAQAATRPRRSGPVAVGVGRVTDGTNGLVVTGGF